MPLINLSGQNTIDTIKTGEKIIFTGSGLANNPTYADLSSLYGVPLSILTNNFFNAVKVDSKYFYLDDVNRIYYSKKTIVVKINFTTIITGQDKYINLIAVNQNNTVRYDAGKFLDDKITTDPLLINFNDATKNFVLPANTTFKLVCYSDASEEFTFYDRNFIFTVYTHLTLSLVSELSFF